MPTKQICCDDCAVFTAIWAKDLEILLTLDCLVAESLHLFLTKSPPPKTLIDSIPLIVSTSMDCFSWLWVPASSLTFDKKGCMAKPTPITTGTAHWSLPV